MNKKIKGSCKNQHIIPQFLQRQFTKTGQLYRHTKEKSFIVNITNNFSQNEYYSERPLEGAKEKTLDQKITEQESLDIHINGVNSKEFPMHFIISNSALHDTVKNSFNYEKSVKNMLSNIVTEISDVKNIRPKGWNNLSENYEEYIGINEIDYKNLKKLFTGIDSATASSLSFEVRTSLPHVMYDYKSQARKPLEVLVGAILAHSFAMNEKNNSVKMLSEWQELESQLKENLNEDINFDFTEPLNKALVDVIKNQGEIKNSTLQILSLNKKTLRNYY